MAKLEGLVIRSRSIARRGLVHLFIDFVSRLTQFFSEEVNMVIRDREYVFFYSVFSECHSSCQVVNFGYAESMVESEYGGNFYEV